MTSIIEDHVLNVSFAKQRKFLSHGCLCVGEGGGRVGNSEHVSPICLIAVVRLSFNEEIVFI